ncbi:MAG: hypothetical protein V1929_11045 [bacterium]
MKTEWYRSVKAQSMEVIFCIWIRSSYPFANNNFGASISIFHVEREFPLTKRGFPSGPDLQQIRLMTHAQQERRSSPHPEGAMDAAPFKIGIENPCAWVNPHNVNCSPSDTPKGIGRGFCFPGE